MNAEAALPFLEPISDASPAGEDLSFDPVLDEIKEARRADDATLAQGDWVRDLKTANWNAVINICENLLRKRTKDLQIIAFYSEALAKKNGFSGLATGLQILEGSLDRFWESIFPTLADGPEERISRLEWLDAAVGDAVRDLPMLPASAGGHSWSRWQESREVENLGLKSPDLKAAAIQAGKLSGEAFDKAVKQAGGPWFKQIHQEILAAQQACTAIIARLDQCLGMDAPTMERLKTAIEGCDALARNFRGKFETLPPQGADPAPAAPAPRAQETAAATAAPPSFPPQGPPASLYPDPEAALVAREQAIVQLRQVANYFRTYEPHSPVAPLVERAARWGEMSLESWLSEVVSDETVLTTLKTLLDFREETR
jgi:type VI secretion system protein ImpA